MHGEDEDDEAEAMVLFDLLRACSNGGDGLGHDG